jgi:cellobiose transport system substrate-binding protein
MKRTWTVPVRVVAAGVLALAATAACSGGQQTPAGKTTLSIAFWGDFGLDELEKQYEAANTNVDIVLRTGEYAAQHDALQQAVIAGSGAADIAAIDEGFIVQFRSQADKFVNLLDKGAGSREGDYLAWKWDQAKTADGKVIGLGTDIGGLAMCYRTDLFQAAGLPTEREAVSALWPTWDQFFAVGQQYVTASGGKKFVDNATNLYNPILGQQPVGHFDTSETLKMDGGPKVAFDLSVKAISLGLSGNLAPFSPEWNAGFTNGNFAVLACPAWMLGHIKNTAGTDGTGQWDVAAIPGGGGNWGGSFLTIPAQGKNIDEAYKFIDWVTQPAQQLAIFQKVGNMPSQPGMYKDPALLDFKNDYFNNAPVGQIFTKTAENLKPQYLGKNNGKVRTAVENVLNSVQGGTLAADQAWAKAVTDAEAAAAA